MEVRNNPEWKRLGQRIGSGLPWPRRRSRIPNKAWEAFRAGFLAKRGPTLSIEDLVECKVEFAIFWDRTQRDRR